MHMIKKIGILAIVYLMSSLHASTSYTWFEIKPGYFLFSNHTLRKIYHGGFEIQGSGSYPLSEKVDLYGSIGYIHAKGTSLQGNQKTSMWQLPINLGLKATACMTERLRCYVAAGPRYFHFHQYNDSTYVNQNISKNGAAFFINGGLYYLTHDCFLLGIFTEYAFERKSFTSDRPNVYGIRQLPVGGFMFGATLGIGF